MGFDGVTDAEIFPSGMNGLGGPLRALPSAPQQRSQGESAVAGRDCVSPEDRELTRRPSNAVRASTAPTPP